MQAGVLPLDLRREELAIRECTKIMAKSNTEPIKQCFLSCQASVEELPREKVTTPMGKMLQQITDMTSSTNLNLNAIGRFLLLKIFNYKDDENCKQLDLLLNEFSFNPKK